MRCSLNRITVAITGTERMVNHRPIVFRGLRFIDWLRHILLDCLWRWRGKPARCRLLGEQKTAAKLHLNFVSSIA